MAVEALSDIAFYTTPGVSGSLLTVLLIDGPVPLPNMPNQIMNRMQVSQGMSFSHYKGTQ